MTASAPARRQRIRPVAAGLERLAAVAPGVQPRIQKAFWKAVYSRSTRRAAGTTDVFMNYGYAPLANGAGADLNALGTALYDRVAQAVPLTGKDVLEVGCGRGGGTVHVSDTYAPSSMVAIDLAPEAIRWCEKAYARAGLRFLVADAENLPFPAGSFDAVLNVESCHCYPDVPAFLAEVHRVLRPGGTLLLADVRHASLHRAVTGGPLKHEDIDDFRAQLEASPLTIIEEEDITANVTRALQLDSPRRREVIERRVPRLFQTQALNFAAVEGTPLHEAYVAGDMTYLRLVLRKDVTA